MSYHNAAAKLLNQYFQELIAMDLLYFIISNYVYIKWNQILNRLTIFAVEAILSVIYHIKQCNVKGIL